MKCRTSVIANIYLLRDIVMLFKGRGGSWMFLMGMNCFTFTYVILLVPCLTLNRCNDRWNTFKDIYFLVCYSKSSFYTFLLYGFCDSCEVHAEIFHTWDMSAINKKSKSFNMSVYVVLLPYNLKPNNVLHFFCLDGEA